MDAIDDLYDKLLVRLGFDSAQVGWSPRLRDLHVRSRARRLQLIPDFFYTSVFSPADLPADAWDATFPHAGVFDAEAQAAYLGTLRRRVTELEQFEREPSVDSTRFYWNNDQFSHADAACYYTLIRDLKPARIVEVGCGHSTKLALHAIAANEAGAIVCVEPHPPAWLGSLRGPIEIVQKPVQQLPPEWFLQLQAGDFLFIDSSHISKTGSDVNHLFLNVLPALARGVVVHVHDICLPFEYPRDWSEQHLCYWNEQYVLAALLTDRARYEVLLGVHFLARVANRVLLDMIPAAPGVFPGGGSLWLRIAGDTHGRAV